ncbi:hypothetical protein TorRG33x02_094900 [Trema orientale]|uniref:Uncharacterized protein n=1 Tax=Trema orientale TaxID=63057 RepID=A0A2P5FA97_TREOI|nr:hypothetical protein TorRG33x02_094900 [Trema orientale]
MTPICISIIIFNMQQKKKKKKKNRIEVFNGAFNSRESNKRKDESGHDAAQTTRQKPQLKAVVAVGEKGQVGAERRVERSGMAEPANLIVGVLDVGANIGSDHELETETTRAWIESLRGKRRRSRGWGTGIGTSP